LNQLQNGTFKHWTKYKNNAIINIYTPSFIDFSVERTTLVDVKERNDNQIIEFSLFTLRKIYEEYPDQKWYVKFDDDGLLFVPNLLKKLSTFDYNKDIFGGHYLKQVETFSGGAGYFMTRTVIKTLSENVEKCLDKYVPDRSKGGPEDLVITKCLGWLFGDKLQTYHVPQMYPFSYQETKDNKLDYTPYGILHHPISFHGIKSNEEALTYMEKVLLIN
jgi:hypothetical protein